MPASSRPDARDLLLLLRHQTSHLVKPSSPAPDREAYLQGLLLASVAAVFFSGKAIVAKLLYREGIDAITLIALRMLLSLPIFMLIALLSWRRAPRLTIGDLWRIPLLGLLGYYVSSTLDFLGLETISVGLERLILFLTPSFVILMGVLRYQRRGESRQWQSLLLAYSGIVLVFWHDSRFGGQGILLGTSLVLLAALSYALYLLLSGELVRRVGSLRLTALAMCAASLAALAQYATLHPFGSLFTQTTAGWELSLLNATACTVLPVFLTMTAVARIGADRASQASMIGPVSTLLLGWWLLDEAASPLQIAGAALVMAGIYRLSQRT